MNTETKTSELRAIALQIEEWRIAHDLSKNQLCQKFGQLGSTKTFGRIIDASDDLEELNVANQLDNYLAAWELIQGYQDNPEDTRIYADFSHMRDAIKTIKEALNEPGNTHFVLITGASGAGKSTVLDLLQQSRETKSITYRVEATEAWREKTGPLLGALLSEVGIFERTQSEDEPDRRPQAPRGLPIGSGARLSKLVERVNGRKVILAIDEFHHIGAPGYNLVKTIINQTKAVVVGAAIPGLVARINRTSYEEASQLFYNRLYEHIRLTAPEAGDVLEFFKRRGLKFATASDASQIAKKVAEDSVSLGLWKYVVRCARKGREASAAHTAVSFANVIARVKRSVSLGA